MSTRRDCLNLTVKGSAMAAAAALLPQGLSAQVNTGDGRNINSMENSADSNSGVHYKPPFRFGLGGVPLGNEFAVVTDKDAYGILEAAWSAGIRYYDVSPWYGLGLAERRYGSFLHNKNRSEYIISSKVGKLLKASKTAKNSELFPFSPSPNDIIFDYTASGVRRSIEDSLQRLGKKNASLVVGSSLNAGFISGSPRYNYGKESYKIPTEVLEKRKRLREVAANHGVDLRTAALQFSASPDVAAALVVGASSEQQILADYTSMQTRIPAEFWAELKAEKLIEQNAPTPA